VGYGLRLRNLRVAPQQFGSPKIFMFRTLEQLYAKFLFPCHFNDMKLTVQGQRASAANKPLFSSEAIIRGAVARAREALFKQNIIPWKLVARNTLESIEPQYTSQGVHIRRLDIIQTKGDTKTTFKQVAGQLDESYQLAIEFNGTARIEAPSSVGVLHALETFVQLFYQHSSGQGVYTKSAPVKISDAPKFPHRGVNLDVSRNW
jgi:hexosaminidase